MRLQKSDFEVHGYTSGCPGCGALIRRVAPQSHSEVCHHRLEQLLHASEDGILRKNLADARIHQRLVEKLEENDKNSIKAQAGADGTVPEVTTERSGILHALDAGESAQPVAVRRGEEVPHRKHPMDTPGE